MLDLSTRPSLDAPGPVCGKQEAQKREVPRLAACMSLSCSVTAFASHLTEPSETTPPSGQWSAGPGPGPAGPRVVPYPGLQGPTVWAAVAECDQEQLATGPCPAWRLFTQLCRPQRLGRQTWLCPWIGQRGRAQAWWHVWTWSRFWMPALAAAEPPCLHSCRQEAPPCSPPWPHSALRAARREPILPRPQ